MDWVAIALCNQLDYVAIPECILHIAAPTMLSTLEVGSNLDFANFHPNALLVIRKGKNVIYFLAMHY